MADGQIVRASPGNNPLLTSLTLLLLPLSWNNPVQGGGGGGEG